MPRLRLLLQFFNESGLSLEQLLLRFELCLLRGDRLLQLGELLLYRGLRGVSR